MKQPTVCVIGSINMDLTITTDKVPEQGETVLGKTFHEYPGGKGANQAVAAARLGANVKMIGAVGEDTYGKALRSHLESEKINMEGINVFSEHSTGIANIILSDNDNRIIVAPGANQLVSKDLIEANRHLIQTSDVVLMQLEIPVETVAYVVDLAYQENVPVILNPAPSQGLPESILTKTTYLTPNEKEAKAIKAQAPSVDKKLIITKGGEGVQFYNKEGIQQIPGYQVEVKDTTGAGDTFNGALALELGRGTKIDEAIRFANAAAALSVTKAGAQGGMPTRQGVELFLRHEI